MDKKKHIFALQKHVCKILAIFSDLSMMNLDWQPQ